jgi:hypothetical protein
MPPSITQHLTPLCRAFFQRAPAALLLGAITVSYTISIDQKATIAHQSAEGQGPTKQGGAREDGEEEENECALCKMVKAGPCKQKFYPFGDCMDKSHEEGTDTAEACREQFNEMMKCIHEHRKEYEVIMDMQDNSDDKTKKSDQDAAPAAIPNAVVPPAAKTTADELAEKLRIESEEYDAMEEAREAAFFAVKAREAQVEEPRRITK